MESRKIRRFAMPAQVAFLLAALWAFVGYWSYSERLRIIELNTVALEQLAASVSEQVLRLFKTAESTLLAENDWLIAHPGVYPNDDPSFVSLVDRQRRLADGFLDMRTLDSGGGIHLIPSPSRASIGTAVDHENFRVQLDPRTRGFYIDAPLLSRTADGWIIPISIPAAKNQADIAVLAAIIEPDDGKDFETLLKKSDTAMYRAKESGRNTYHFYNEEMNTKALETLRLRNGLRQALANGEFVLHYQPQIDLTSGQVVGVEALIRWNHRELGMVPPGRFIPLAEHSGLIVQIGEWVIAEACRQAVAWQRAGLPSLMVAVNLSALQLRRGNLERTLIDALQQSGLDPRLLELELTESSLIHDTQSVHATLEKLKRLGLRLAIDDFGTGYSSLSYLKRLKVDRLKIDRSFVRDAATDPENAAIVRTIIQMAKSLNLKTIAEGIEDAETLAFLRLCQCDEGQGYHIGRPMAADALAATLMQVG